jgi:hypothetical protein
VNQQQLIFYIKRSFVQEESKWPLFEAKMQAAGLSAAAIGAFKQNYDQLVAGVTGMVSRRLQSTWLTNTVTPNRVILAGGVQRADSNGGRYIHQVSQMLCVLLGQEAEQNCKQGVELGTYVYGTFL